MAKGFPLGELLGELFLATVQQPSGAEGRGSQLDTSSPGNGLGGINLQLILGLVNLQKQAQGLQLWPQEVLVCGCQPGSTEPLGRWDGSPGKAVHPSARTV